MAVGTVEEMINDMENGLYDFTENGKCIGCGQCCSSLLPISSKEIKQIKSYIKKHHITEQKYANNFLSKQPELDLTCPFMDDSKPKDKCLIYEVRPKICRVFQCNIPPSKVKENKEEFMRKHFPTDMRAEFFGGKSIFEKMGEFFVNENSIR